jgi:hypothetical protein
MKNAPIKETGIAIIGINVVRQLLKNKKMIRITSPKANSIVS